MQLSLFLAIVLSSLLLNLCKVDAVPIQNKVTSHIAGNNNNKRDATPPTPNVSSNMDAGGIMMQIAKDYMAKHSQQGASLIETPPTKDNDEDATEAKLKIGIENVKKSLDAFLNVVKGDESIWGEIKKRELPAVEKALKDLENLFDPKDTQAANEAFAVLVNAVTTMSAKVVEQNDDANYKKLLSAVNQSLKEFQNDLNASSSSSSPASGGTNADLNGLTGAINGDQEA